MKPTYSFLSVLLMSTSLQAATSRVEDVNNTLFTLTGPTTTIEGNNATFPGAAGVRWTPTNGAVSGTDRIGTTVASPANNDFFFNFDPTALASQGTLTVADNRYVEIHYTMTGNWTGGATTHALRVDTSGNPAEFVSFINRGIIPAGNAVGPQSIIIDLDVNNNLSGNWNVLRWDFFNVAGNGGGKTFTVDKIVYGNTITAVPEPSVALLGGLGLMALLRRRRQ